MTLTNQEIQLLLRDCQDEQQLWTKNTEMNLLRFAVLNLHTELLAHYNDIDLHCLELLKSNTVLDNHGNPKKVAKLIDIKEPNAQQQTDFEWKNEGAKEKFQKELGEYMRQTRDVAIRKYDLNDIMKCHIKVSESHLFNIIKYTSL